MKQDFEPIQMYLEEKLGIPVKVIVTENYVGLIDGMKNSTIDIGWYGAFSYIAAESEMKLNPLVLETRKDSGPYYQSLIITLKTQAYDPSKDWKGIVRFCRFRFYIWICPSICII